MAYDKIKDALKEPKKKPKPQTDKSSKEEKLFVERIKK
jgi:hypothetical protein